MIAQLTYENRAYSCDLSQPTDISIETGRVKCFYAPDFKAYPFQAGDFVGSVQSGAPVNFFNVELNPHGNGTHTECLGHITPEQESIHRQLKCFHFFARVISVELASFGEIDQIITRTSIQQATRESLPEALIIRTLPNEIDKANKDYSGTNPPYIEEEAMKYIVDQGVEHILLDLPSVDREIDDGVLAAHHIFWGLAQDSPEKRAHCTITEMIFVPNHVPDGFYLLNLQIPPFPLDAAPSKPVIYSLY